MHSGLLLLFYLLCHPSATAVLTDQPLSPLLCSSFDKARQTSIIRRKDENGSLDVIWTSPWKTLGHFVPSEPCWDATDMEDGPNFTTLNSKTPTPTTILQVQVVLKFPQMWVTCGVWTPVQEQRKAIFSEICCVTNHFKQTCSSRLWLKLTIEAACRQRLCYERTIWVGALLISTLITHRGVGTYSDRTYWEGSYHFSKPGFCMVKDSFLVTVYPYKCFESLKKTPCCDHPHHQVLSDGVQCPVMVSS